MDNTIPLPTLSSAGWVKDKAAKADGLLANFFLTNKSQSFIYQGKLSSAQWLIQQYGDNISTLTQQMRMGLEIYLHRYYDVAVVTVSNDDNAANLNGAITLSIHMQVTENGVSYSVGKILESNNGKITKFFNQNN